jgi:spore coat polysaccharide biosynthesis protein SpsF
MKTIAIIQARLGSTRLPGKVLLRLAEDTVLGHVVRRVRACPRLNGVIVATTVADEDAAIVTECQRLGVPSFRGSAEDVLARYFHAAQGAGAEAVVRVTSDCPLFDPELLDRMLETFHRLNATAVTVDYLSNTLRRTFPRGLDAEIFTFAALRDAFAEATSPHEREHVTPFFYEHPERFRLHSVEGPTDLSAHRWTLDTPDDWKLIESVYRELHTPGGMFTTAEVLKLLRARPELATLNAHVEQKKLGR